MHPFLEKIRAANARRLPANANGPSTGGSFGMEKFATALEMVTELKPQVPVFAARPHAAGRAARWFIKNFPGEVAYAYKANSSVFLLGALYGAGITQFDVASLAELEDAATIPGVRLHYMHP